MVNEPPIEPLFDCPEMQSDIDAPDDLLYDAWCVIANAAGWDEDSEWRRAAIRWRDNWHETMADE
jgi:hypothetical protein